MQYTSVFSWSLGPFTRVFKFNTSHEPAGSAKGGQFAKKPATLTTPLISPETAAALNLPHSSTPATVEDQTTPVHVKDHMDISSGVNGAYLVTLADGSKAAYKPEVRETWKGSFANHDISRLITNRDFSLAEREALAWEVDQALGTNLVPKTVLRENVDVQVSGSGGGGSSSSGGGGQMDSYELREMYDEYQQRAQEQAMDEAGQKMGDLYQQDVKDLQSNMENRVDEARLLWDEVVTEHPELAKYGSPTFQRMAPVLPLGSEAFHLQQKVIDPLAVLDEANVDMDGSLSTEEKHRVKELLTQKLLEGHLKFGVLDEDAAENRKTYSSWIQEHEDTENQLIGENIKSFDAWKRSQGYDSGGGSSRRGNDQAPHPHGGSLQAFIEDASDSGFLSDTDASNFAVLDYVVGSMDRHGGNTLYDADDNPKAIDNGYSFPGSSTPDQFVFRSTPVRDWKGRGGNIEEDQRKEILARMEQTDWQALVDRHPSMSTKEREALLGRVKKMKDALRTETGLYMLWRRLTVDH